jgi:O-antigen ligase
MYLGVLVLGLCLVTRANVSSLLNGLACAVLLVSGLAVLSRLEPSWFAPLPAQSVYSTPRLAYPFDYADGVGEFAAIGLPLLLFVATSARTRTGRSLAAAGLPVVALCVALTVSRGGVLACGVGLVVFFALVPDRLPRFATAVVAAAATVIPVLTLLQHPGERTALLAHASASERHKLLAVILLACAGAAVLQLAITLVVRHVVRPRFLRFSRGQALGITALVVAAAAAAVIAGAVTGVEHHLWEEFKRPNPPSSSNIVARLLSLAGSHRYQYWQAAIHAFDGHPWKGIGPGTFQFFWAQHNSLSEYVQNAHSLYFESLAETGIVGLVLIGGLVVFVVLAGAVRALGATAASRLAIATGVAGVAAFAAAAAFDWVWQIGVVPMVALLLAAVAVSGLRDRERIGPGQRLPVLRVAVVVAALVALWRIVVPLSSTVEVRSSQAAAAVGAWPAALRDANTAKRLEPGAASPWVQRALVLEAVGDLGAARRTFSQALVREPTNSAWWLIASRLATEANRPRRALTDWNRARSLDPTSPTFQP